MDILEKLGTLSSAEEFFDTLGVAYDPEVLRVARLHILKRMGEYLSGDSLAGLGEAETEAACRAHLQRAYADFTRSSPLKERVFKVLKDATGEKPSPRRPFVPLSSLTGQD
ncbi:nitrogenase stabilizing/protective protein NifW [Afifella sp. IM 167]|uniref:nitrogenase stabilizing/protective protein NifW n=1 Tax=Afifella sp. IM 167 TaxID=2033586 RepID=UPI001CC920F7|nr:nitrogenase stabilizing/protective protein NifW [Afifella sp. IM 167]MBZ8135272.1 nitrogenase stabilizing/protective protein NifW [Afifella sp. IM 167]